MLEVVIMFLTQLLFQLARVFSNRMIAKDQVALTIIMTAIVQALWLVTTAMGVHAAFELDIATIIAYMVGGLIGAYYAMVIDFIEVKLWYENKILEPIIRILHL